MSESKSQENQTQKDRPDRAVEAGRGALFIGFAKAFFMVAGFLQRVLLARVISPAEYGAFSVVNNAISTVNNTMVQGTIQSVSKFTAEDDARAGAVQHRPLIGAHAHPDRLALEAHARPRHHGRPLWLDSAMTFHSFLW